MTKFRKRETESVPSFIALDATGQTDKKGQNMRSEPLFSRQPSVFEKSCPSEKLIQTENDHHYIDEIEDPNS